MQISDLIRSMEIWSDHTIRDENGTLIDKDSLAAEVKALETDNAELAKLGAELEQNLAWRDTALNQCQAQNAALTKRVAELEAKTQMLDTHVEHWASKALTLEGTERHLRRVIADLQSQLAWTPVSAGLPTEPGDYLFAVRGSVTHAALVSAMWFTPDGETFEPRGHYRRIELPKDGES